MLARRIHYPFVLLFLSASFCTSTPTGQISAHAERPRRSQERQPDSLGLSLGPPAATNVKGKEKVLLPLMKELGQSYRQDINRVQDKDSEEEFDKDWLSLGHTGPTSAAVKPARQPYRKARIPVLGAASKERAAIEAQTKNWHTLDHEAIFHRLWYEKGLGDHLEASDLATQIRSIKIKGVSPQMMGKWSRDLLKKHDVKPEYYAEYSNTYRRTGNRLSHFKGQVPPRLNGELLSDEEREEMALKLIEQSDKKRSNFNKNYKKSNTHLKEQQEAAQRIARVGQHFEAYFKRQRKDITKMSTMDIENQSRDLSLPEFDNCVYAKYLNRYLEENRKDVVDMPVFRHLRETYARQKYDQRRNRSKKAV